MSSSPSGSSSPLMSFTRLLWRLNSLVLRERLKLLLLVVLLSSLFYGLSTTSMISTLRRTPLSANENYLGISLPSVTMKLIENGTLDGVLNANLSVTLAKAIQIQHRVTTLRRTTTTTTVKKQVPTQPYGNRFQFIFKKKKLSLDGPIMNPIPMSVTWREDLKHIQICNLTYPFILVMVPSAVGNMAERNVVRKTWASPKFYGHTGIRALFVLGATVDQVLQEKVDRESKEFNDILQYNFIDSYRNLTYKTMSWLTWVNRRCPDVPFVTIIDDDVIVNPFHLHTYLINELKKPAQIKLDVSDGSTSPPIHRPELLHPATNYIYGKLETNPPPHRNDKWVVTKYEYPENRYPPFVLGPAYILGGNVVGRLLKYAPYTPLLWLEDVYTTGLVAHAAQIQHVQVTTTLFCVRSYNIGIYTGTKSFWMEHQLKDRNATWNRILLSSGIKT